VWDAEKAQTIHEMPLLGWQKPPHLKLS
jgi:hypothetical protein